MCNDSVLAYCMYNNIAGFNEEVWWIPKVWLYNRFEVIVHAWELILVREDPIFPPYSLAHEEGEGCV